MTTIVSNRQRSAVSPELHLKHNVQVWMPAGYVLHHRVWESILWRMYHLHDLQSRLWSFQTWYITLIAIYFCKCFYMCVKLKYVYIHILKHRGKTLVAILFVLFSGTADSDVKCEQCADGTFSDRVSNTDSCRPHTKWLKDTCIYIQILWKLRYLTCLFPAVSVPPAAMEVLLKVATLLQMLCAKLESARPTYCLKTQQKSLLLRLSSQPWIKGWSLSQNLRLRLDPYWLFQRLYSTSQQKAHLQGQCLAVNWVWKLVC